jgi:hypothetical protein
MALETTGMTSKKPQVVYDGLRAHLNRFWPRNEKEEFTWDIGPIRSVLPDFRVVRIAPLNIEEPWIYASLGVWEVAKSQASRTEFFLTAPSKDPIHVETLAMLANFHADPAYEVRLGKTINIGRGWVDGSTCDYLLVSLPYPFGPEFERVQIRAIEISYLWLLPITKAEEGFLKTFGQEALEQRLEQSKVDVINLTRPSVV